MASRSTTASEDAERLQEELPKGLSVPLEETAGLLEKTARLGLEVTLWPFRALPSSLRNGLGRGLRAGVAASAVFSHALTRAVRETADRLLEDSGED